MFGENVTIAFQNKMKNSIHTVFTPTTNYTSFNRLCLVLCAFCDNQPHGQ